MTRRRRQFDASFRREVVRMVRVQGLSVGGVSRSMDLVKTGLAALGRPVRDQTVFRKSLFQNQRHFQISLR
jgi:hypothetical protein